MELLWSWSGAREVDSLVVTATDGALLESPSRPSLSPHYYVSLTIPHYQKHETRPATPSPSPSKTQTRYNYICTPARAPHNLPLDLLRVDVTSHTETFQHSSACANTHFKHLSAKDFHKDFHKTLATDRVYSLPTTTFLSPRPQYHTAGSWQPHTVVQLWIQPRRGHCLASG